MGNGHPERYLDVLVLKMRTSNSFGQVAGAEDASRGLIDHFDRSLYRQEAANLLTGMVTGAYQQNAQQSSPKRTG